jgi:DNA-binding protein H-NS
MGMGGSDGGASGPPTQFRFPLPLPSKMVSVKLAKSIRICEVDAMAKRAKRRGRRPGRRGTRRESVARPSGASGSLASMSVDALPSLRDNIGRVLAERTGELRRQLQRLGGGSRSSLAGTRSRSGGKIAAKYRDPDNPQNTWAGRGAIPRWMAEKIDEGAKREDFLIGAPGASTRKRRSAKKTSRGAKAKTSTRKATGKRRRPRRSDTTSNPNSSAASGNGSSE